MDEHLNVKHSIRLVDFDEVIVNVEDVVNDVNVGNGNVVDETVVGQGVMDDVVQIVVDVDLLIDDVKVEDSLEVDVSDNVNDDAAGEDDGKCLDTD